MFQTKVVEKLRTRILRSIFFFSKNLQFEKIRKNVAEPGMSQITIWRMRFACWIPKATDTHSKYVILIAFPLQHWLQERASMLPVFFFFW
jgi:hypothetical protein